MAKYYYQAGKPVGLEWESGRKHLPKGEDANFLILAGFGLTVIIAAIAYSKMRSLKCR